MRYIWFEVKKMIGTPLVWIVLAVVIALDIFSILLAGNQSKYIVASPDFKTELQDLKEQRTHFAGAITPDWIELRQQEEEAILHDPQYRVSEEEAEKIVETQVRQYGYDEERVRERLFLFLNERGMAEYDKYEDVLVASNFYSNAKRFRDHMAEYYQNAYPGKKGETLAADTRKRYNDFIGEYIAMYNYDYGYKKVRTILATYPYTVGAVILIALAPLFSNEYTRKTDALLLSSKDGKKNLAYNKMKAGLIVAVAAWGIMTIFNLLIIFSTYGLTGWEAYWQNWLLDVAPFPWSQGQATVVAIVTSLLGSLFFAQIVMLVSSMSKNQFVSLFVGAVLLLFPMIDFAFTNSNTINMVYNFLPTRIMMGMKIWQGYGLFYVAGFTFPCQYAAVAFAVIVSVAVCPLTKHFFTRRQIGN